MKRYGMSMRVIGWLFAAVIVTSCAPATEPSLKGNAALQGSAAVIERAEGSTGADAGLYSDVRHEMRAQPAHPSYTEALTALFDAAYLEQDQYDRYDNIVVRWPAQLSRGANIVIRIQTASGRIYLEKQLVVEANIMDATVVDLGKAYLIPAGKYQIVIMPSLGEYYLRDVRVQRKIEIALNP